MKSEEISRRSFLKRALALSAVSAIPSFWTPAHGRVLPTSPLISANDRVNIAFIGIGQRGGEIAKELYNTGLCNVVALCDVDMGAPHTQEIINMFPKAARFQDFRTMFDRMADKIDAVSVGVPDHSHFPITIEAIQQNLSMNVLVLFLKNWVVRKRIWKVSNVGRVLRI